MRNRMYFGDLLVTREIKALDSAWEEFVQDEYRLMFVSEIPTSDIERIEDKRTLYLEERARLKGKFSKREEESEVEDGEITDENRGFIKPVVPNSVMGKRAVIPCIDEIAESFTDDPMVNAVLDERNMTKKPDTIVVFNKHDNIKGSTCDGLEEFLRRTLKEDE